MGISLAAIDYLVIAFYFVLVFFIAWKVTDKKNSEESSDYFLAGRNLGWFAIGASLFASNIGSEHLIGLAGSGAKGGVAVAQFEILAGIILLLLGWVFVPFYLRSGVSTMPEFLEKRYNSWARNYLSGLSIIAYVITKISVTIFAGAVVFEAIGFDFWIGAVVIVLSTGIYTVMGGLKAVIYTDMIQMFIMIFGAIAITILGLKAVGGWNEVTTTLSPEFFSMWKSMQDPEFPWTGIVFGAPILAIWYWCTDQFIVQRVLSAKNIHEARRGAIFGGFLKQLPLFIFVIPGMICAALVAKGLLTLEKPDHALPTLIASILPVGIKGLVVAGLLAALMSSLSSVFNSCSTLITYDIYKRMNPNASEKKLVQVGQAATIILVGAGLLWIPLMDLISGNLFNYLQSVQAYISPPIAAVFLLGIFIKKINSKGAIASLGVGFILGIARLILEMNKTKLSGFLYNYADINFLHFALFLFVVCAAVLILVSLMTSPDKQNIDHITYQWKEKWLINSKTKNEIILSVLLFVIIAVVWIIFS